jgi:hypothetical protein
MAPPVTPRCPSCASNLVETGITPWTWAVVGGNVYLMLCNACGVVLGTVPVPSAEAAFDLSRDPA